MTSVSVSNVSVTTKDNKKLLNNISLTFRPGKLTAIIAPTGAGKSTLLNTIAGRCSLEISGAIALGQKQIDPRKNRDRFGYVTASDSLFGTLTPKEAFMFALTLGRTSQAATTTTGPATTTTATTTSATTTTATTTHDETENKVKWLLDQLKLSHCANTLIGNASIKGLSSGERKRVAVGLEMLNEPEIFLLDEPTSGLDSYSAQLLVELLRSLAANNTTVIATIHQPSSKLFNMFDDVIFMQNGKVAYSGPVQNVSNFFKGVGHECGQDSNPADHAMLLLQTLNEGECDKMRLGEGDKAVNVSNDKMVAVVEGVAVEESSAKKRAGFSRQLLELTKRELKNFVRDRDAMKARLLVSIFLTVIISLVYWQIGDNTTDAVVNLSHIGAITLVAVNCMFANSQLLLLSFPLERPVFIREYSSGLYSSAAYAVSKWLVEWPVLFAQICLQVLIAYFMMGLRGSFIGLVYSCFLITVASSSVALLVSAVATDARQALEAAPIIFVPQIYYTGFFLESVDQMPAVLRWGRYLCSLKYGLNIAIISEFGEFTPGVDAVYRRFDISTDSEWWYALILVLITLVFRVLAILALKSRAFWSD